MTLKELKETIENAILTYGGDTEVMRTSYDAMNSRVEVEEIDGLICKKEDVKEDCVFLY